MKKKFKNIRCMILLVFLFFLITISCFAGNKISIKPNVIIIFTDDQGYGDLGCYGSPNIRTPNIDQMAEEGIRLTSFYGALICGPSRSQIMTGCYHARVSHSHNEFPQAKTGLHPNEITIAEILKTAGYNTMHIGKWHLGHVPQFLPTRQGFDNFFGIPYSNDMWPYHPRMAIQENEDELMKQMRERAAYTGYGGQGKYYKKGNGFQKPLPLMLNEKIIEKNPDQTQLTSQYTEAALKFIDNNKDKPFFLYLAHTMPHVPLFVSEKYAGKSDRDLYGDVIMEIDWSCGRIINKLKELGIEENTLVVFTSDNGPWLDYGIDGGSAGPLRDGKGTIYEGGMRVPAIVKWKGKLSPGRRSGAISGNIDLLPTIAFLAGAKLPDDRVIDGKNIWPLLSGNTEASPHQFFHYFGVAGSSKPANYKAIRSKKWKLLMERNSNGELIPSELYNLDADISEKFDRSKQHPAIANRLLKEAQSFLKKFETNRRPIGRIED